MSLETGSYIDDLVATNPTATDPVSQGDDHLRLIKAVLKATFPNVDGALNATPAEFNYLVGVTSLIQDQFDAKHGAVGDGLQEDDAVTVSVSAGVGIDTTSGNVDVDISGLDPIEANALVAADGILVDNGGVMERMEYSDSGFPVVDVATTTETLATADMNTVRRYTHASGCAVTLNTGVGKKGNWLVLIQGTSGQVTTTGTSTRNGANGTDTRDVQYTGITLFCVAANTWIVLGDAG